MQPDPTPIDADGYCLSCWDYCTSFEECQSNRAKNRDHVLSCPLVDSHPAHDWTASYETYFCKGRDNAIPQELW